MEFNVSRKPLLKALSFCQSVVEKKTAMPVLSHVLLKAEAGMLNIVATDLDMVISEKIAADIQQEGAFCIPAALTYEIVKRLEGFDKLSFVYEAPQLFLRCGRSEFKLSIIPHDEFPDVSQLPLSSTFVVDPIGFKQLIDETRLCWADDEDIERALHGVYLHIRENNKLYCAGTDFHRFGVSCVELAQTPVLSEGLIVGKKAIGEIRKLMDDKVQTVTLGASSARIQCNTTVDGVDIMFSARLLDGIYPDYQKLLNQTPNIKIVFNRANLLAALEHVAVITDEKSPVITFEFKQNLATITAVNLDSGSAKEDVEASCNYDTPFSIQFNATYIIAMVRKLAADHIQLALDTPHDAVHIQAVGIQFPHYVIMPLAT